MRTDEKSSEGDPMISRRRTLGATILGALLPGAARAQQPAMPVIGFLSSRSPEQGQYLVAAIRQGLRELGYVEGQNVTIEYRWAQGYMDRLDALAAELVRQQVAVIIAGGTPLAARAATSSIPIVFTTGLDPVAYGLIKSFNRPEGNITGATFYSGALGPKQLQLLRELIPSARTFGFLVKPDSPSAAPQVESMQRAAQSIGQRLQILNANVEDDFEPLIAGLARRKNAALIVSVDPYFDSRATQLVGIAARHALPAIYNIREFVQAGGLASYGSSITDTYRQAGVYAARLLKGAKPSELPVQLPTKYEFVINMTAAKALGIKVPQSLLVRADEVLQ
jgi:putative ABC transport system substrate-binding protein